MNGPVRRIRVKSTPRRLARGHRWLASEPLHMSSSAPAAAGPYETPGEKAGLLENRSQPAYPARDTPDVQKSF